MNAEKIAVQEIVRHTMVARLAALSHNGRATVTPIYFVHVDGRIWLGTVDWTLAARNARADPRVSVLLEIENDASNRQLVRIRGHATVRTDDRTQRSYARRVARKYILTKRGLHDYLTHIPQLRPMHYYHAQQVPRAQVRRPPAGVFVSQGAPDGGRGSPKPAGRGRIAPAPR